MLFQGSGCKIIIIVVFALEKRVDASDLADRGAAAVVRKIMC